MFSLFIMQAASYITQPMMKCGRMGWVIVLLASVPGLAAADLGSTTHPVLPPVPVEQRLETAQSVPPVADAPAVPVETTPEKEFWFPVGEELVYDIYWGKIHVGQSRVTTSWREEEGRQLLSIRLKTRTNRVLSVMYPVDDYIESLIDPKDFIPVSFVKKLSEGRARKDEMTRFDHSAGVAHWQSNLNGKKASFPIEKDTRDIPSLMYFLRQCELQPGESYEYQVMADEKVYAMTVHATKLETVRLSKYGRVPSILLEPMASFGGVFVRKGRMWMWVSRDSRRVATKISVEVPFANIHLYLREILGPGSENWPAPILPPK